MEHDVKSYRRCMACAFVGLLVACSGQADAQVDHTAWLSASLARVHAAAQGWNVGDPQILQGDADYALVAPNGTIVVGKVFLDKLAAEKLRDELLQFALLHEYRHVHQLRSSFGQASTGVLECDADFHATLRLATTMLQKMPKGGTNTAIGSVLDLQRSGARLHRLVSSGGHGHLTGQQRFLTGAFASWRAIHQWLQRSGNAGETRYAQLATRARSFVEILPIEEEASSKQFCDLLIHGGNTERSSIQFSHESFEFVEANRGPGWFKHGYEISNSGDWPLHVIGWQVLGFRDTTDENDLSQYMAAHANAINVTIPPGDKVAVSWLQMLPGRPSNTVVFRWSDPSFSQIPMSVSRAGPRRERPNCQASWTPPADAGLNELFGFLLRTGNVAGRQFKGIRGEMQQSFIRTSLPIQFHNFATLPTLAHGGSSYITMNRDGSGASARIELLETETQADAQKYFDEMVAAFRASCGVNVVEEEREQSGEAQLHVHRLTLLSEATLYLSIPDDKDSLETQLFSVAWVVRPVDE